ncbi:hypothetical protein E8E13_003909 [Curvularia kusanoi]|uniref:Uncharacterized protein n=1 Tax=Curvularia kusanoi TaxID=90978 RepID=A0A9P4TGZ8_CURKU|nr:hypothetical protein E8E13_003909 [Curvularia kusanoi]
MSSHIGSGLLPSFSAAATQTAVEASDDNYPTDYIINIILEISGYLVSLDEQTKLFGRSSTDPYSPSLRTLQARLHGGQLSPTPVQAHANESARIKATIHKRTTKTAAHRPLEDFEDLYYAVLARMQDIQQLINARLGSGFNNFNDLIYPDGPSIADLYNSLAQYWDVLNHTGFVKPIDCAVRRARVEYLHQEIIAQVHNDEITQADAEELLNDLLDPEEYDNIQGLAWIGGWAPGMVAAWLEEKYRIVLQVEKEAAEETDRMEKKRVKADKVQQPQQEIKSKKEGKKTLHGTQLAVQAVENLESLKEPPQEQLRIRHQNLRDELYELEWRIKAQRVSEYSQYLRSMASPEARNIIARTASKNVTYMSGLGGPVQKTSKEDSRWFGRGF